MYIRSRVCILYMTKSRMRMFMRVFIYWNRAKRLTDEIDTSYHRGQLDNNFGPCARCVCVARLTVPRYLGNETEKRSQLD